MKINKLTVVVSVALSGAGFNALAGTNLADARSVAMGGTGVASADFLTSSFHNPALGAVYRNEDDFGVLLPGVGASLNDSDDVLDTIDDAGDIYDNNKTMFDTGNQAANTDGQAESLSALMDKLENKDPVFVNVAAGAAIAIPTQYVSVNLFADGYADVAAISDIASKVAGYSASDVSQVKSRFEDSEVGLAGIIATEVGIALSKQFDIYGQAVSFGVSPKVQQFQSYASTANLSDFDLDDFDENKTTTNAFNMDLGAVWTSGYWRAAVAVKDIIAKDIKTKTAAYTYQVAPKVTVGGAFVSDYFVASVDADVTKEERFTNIADDTQYIRFGIEGNAWGWAQLRAGYAYDMEGNAEDTITAGIGISPFDVVSFDVAGSYASDTSLGASANLAFTF